jgi:hypothetical protein
VSTAAAPFESSDELAAASNVVPGALLAVDDDDELGALDELELQAMSAHPAITSPIPRTTVMRRTTAE